MGLVASASKAAGMVFISPPNALTWRLSGFFVSERFFISRAHFEVDPVVEAEMRGKTSKVASLCSRNKPYGIPSIAIPKSRGMTTNACPIDKDKAAHLVHRDKQRDIAIFCLNVDQPPQSDYLELDVHFPGVDRWDFTTQLADRRAFAIGYNLKHRAGDFKQARSNVIQNLSPNKKLQAESTALADPDFDEVFIPGRKTISVGRLHSDPPANGANLWKHRITGWYGISGAMIACLDQSPHGDAKVQVLGICKFTQPRTIL
jgi:hypothetical protein